jgi:hypothetical protein
MGIMDGILGEVIVMIISAIATSVCTSWLYWRKARSDLEREYLSRFNTQKWAVYTRFVQSLQSLLNIESAESAGAAYQEMVFASQISLIGSDEVVKTFRRWREVNRIYGKSHTLARERLFDLVVRMRNDLGVKYSKLSAEDILGVLDPEDATG